MTVLDTDTNIIAELEQTTETPGKDAQDKGEAGEDKGRVINRTYSLL